MMSQLRSNRDPVSALTDHYGSRFFVENLGFRVIRLILKSRPDVMILLLLNVDTLNWFYGYEWSAVPGKSGFKGLIEEMLTHLND